MGRWKKRLTFIIAVIFAGAAAAAAWSVLEYTAWPELSIGGCQISEEEYLNCMESVEYDTKIQIQQKFNADYDEDFWTKKYEGSYGYEILAENTVERLKYIHAVYDIAEENGDVDDGGYGSLKSRWEDENASRSEKSGRGEAVYGLKEYTFELYLQYEMSSLKETYCNDRTRAGMDLTEQEVLEHYNSHEWIFAESDENADLDQARIAVERELREQKYDDMVMQRAKDSEVDGNMKEVFEFTLNNI